MAFSGRWDSEPKKRKGYVKPKEVEKVEPEVQQIEYTSGMDTHNWYSSEMKSAQMLAFLQAMQDWKSPEIISEKEAMKEKAAFSIGPEHIGKKLICVDNSYGGWGKPKILDYVVPVSVEDGKMADQILKFSNNETLFHYHAAADCWTPRNPPEQIHYGGSAKVWGFYDEVITEPIALRELTKDNYGDTIRYDNEKHRTIVFDSFETDQVTGSIYVRGVPIKDSAGGFADGGRPRNPAFPEMAYYFYSNHEKGTDSSSNWWLVKKKDGSVEVNLEKEAGEETMSAEMKSSSDSVVMGLAALIAPEIEKRLAGTIDEKRVNELIKKAMKPKILEVHNVDTKSVELIESPHKDLERLLYLIQKRHHVYLYGPAGSGKSTAAGQIAKALKLSFGYLSLNPQTPDSRILGFLDAGGTYRKTPFYDCYKNGGVFCIDEMDNASASLLTTLNSMLENGYGAFPGELVSRHKDFVLVATGNTNGRGANPMFPERRPFDVAFAERFTFLYWDYDVSLERKVTLSINPKAEEWLNWVWKARDYTAKNYPKVLVSPRAAFKGAEYLLDGKMTAMEICEAIVFKGLDKATIDKITSNCPLPSIKAMAAK